MKKLFALIGIALAGQALVAQQVVVNLQDGSAVRYESDDIKSVDFAPADYSGTYYYATTDMTFAEFFAGELSQSAASLQDDGVDAVTSATNTKAMNFTSCVVNEEGNVLEGVKAVSVRLTEPQYQALTEDEKARYTFVSDTVFADFKELKADGSFSAYRTTPVKAEDATVTLSAGAFTWGDYGLTLANLPSTFTRGDVQGVVLQISTGVRYALVPLYNIWLNASNLAFCVKSFTEPHGNKPAFTHTAGLAGKTITRITYLLKGMAPVEVDCNVYVNKQSSAAVEVAIQEDKTVQIAITDAPADANFSLTTVKQGSGRGAVTLTADDYTFENGVLTLKGEIAEGALYGLTFTADKYASLTATVQY